MDMEKKDIVDLYRYRKRYLSTAAVAGVLGCVLLTGCGRDGEEAREVSVKNVAMNPMTEEQTSKVEYGDVVRRKLFDGVITPYVEELAFPEDGIFLNYLVTLGDRVKEGQLLATTDVGDAEAQVEKYQEQIEELTDTYNYDMQTKKNSQEIARIELQMVLDRLEEENYLSGQYTQLCIQAGRWDEQIRRLDLEMKHLTEDYEITLPYLKEKLTECKEKLTSNQIVAPFDGVITSMKSQSYGSRVTGEMPCIAISDTSKYQIVSEYVSQNTMEDSLGVTAFINGTEYPVTYVPMDEEVYYSILKRNQTPYSTYEIEPSSEVAHGGYAVIVLTESKEEKVLKVPGIAVHQDGSRKYCYVKRGDKKEKVYIQVELYDTIDYEVISGLEEGDEVYLD